MNEPQPKRRRRWYQFSLRTLMLFMLVCVVSSAWVGWKLDETRREQAVVAKLESRRGWVDYHEMDGPPWITRHFRKVSTAHLELSAIGDAKLKHLQAFTDLETLSLSYTRVTDPGLVHLKELTRLKVLSLANTQVTDAGLVHLEGMTALETLHLHTTKITDAGLEHLKGLTNLQELWLFDTQVTDEGVTTFQQALPDCGILYLANTPP
jgi:hypothetical protein